MEVVSLLYMTLTLGVYLIKGKIPSPDACGSFYHHRPEFDNYRLDNGSLGILYPEVEFKWTECFTKCFYHSNCNVVVLNRNNGQCRLFDNNDKDLSSATPDPGAQYWAADCEFYKVPNTDNTTATGCSSTTIPVTDPDFINSVCYSGGSWIPTRKCGQNLWVEPTETVFKIPSPLVTGVIIEVIGSRHEDIPIYLMLKDDGGSKVASLLWTSRTWGGFSVYVDGESIEDDNRPFSVGSGEEFTLVVTINADTFEGVLNGERFYSGKRMLPLVIYKRLHSDGYQSVRKIHIKYP
ncbi:uncharacterized protein LOC124272428 [Haliotis rubra]|uniref:uncharacterized protein LOC124272428 n=1 Tax=Haliotis rubra TaxID=36100 RepID=UPI001EE567A0|nr:uncharacterized protein LOC124272428 [Haliotis rubra]